MIRFFKSLFGSKTVEEPAAPYKVETPVVEEVKASPVAEKAVEAVVKSTAKPAPKKQGGKKQGGNKPKAPRKPKAPKAPKA